MPKIRAVSYLLVALGWLTSLYLLWPYFTPESGVPGCSGCGVLANTASAWQLGFPLAGWGLGYFTLVGALVLWRDRMADNLFLLVSASGAGVSLILLSHLLSGSVVWCQFCVVTHAINLLLVTSLWVSAGSRAGADSNGDWFSGKGRFAVLAGIVLVSAGIEAALFQPEMAPDDALASFETEPVQELALSTGESPSDGATAVDVSVFSCFRCPGCQGFAATSEVLRQRFGDRLHFTYNNFPLSTTCNPALTYDMHPRACEAAWAAEAARQQGMFWEYHDALFLHSDMSASEPTLEAIARDLGLDMAQWNADRTSPLVQQKVSQDIQRGLEIRIDVTPSVFVNGRRVREPSLPVLTSLIENELQGR